MIWARSADVPLKAARVNQLGQAAEKPSGVTGGSWCKEQGQRRGKRGSDGTRLVHGRPPPGGRREGRLVVPQSATHTGAHGSWNVRVPVSDLGRSAIRRAKSMSLPALSLPRIATRPALEPRRRRRLRPHLLARAQTRVPLACGADAEEDIIFSLISLHSPHCQALSTLTMRLVTARPWWRVSERTVQLLDVQQITMISFITMQRSACERI